MGGDGHGHDPPYKIPDYTMFKIAGCKQLEEVERELAKRGLKDPWLRNEVWRYNKGFGTRLGRAYNLFFRGFLLGLALTAATVAFDKATESSGGHGHGHDGAGHH